MTVTPRTFRIFISSPADVRPERLIAQRVVERLDREFEYHCRIEPVLWERRPLVATKHFQHPDNIPAPRTTDIVVVILWSRLGVQLPAPDFTGPVSGQPVTGTEWEFEDAWQASKSNPDGLPDLMVYRKTAPWLASSEGDEAEERLRQKRLVEDFVRRWLQNSDGSFKAASSSFDGPAEFEETLYKHLRSRILERLGNPSDLHRKRWHKGSPFRGLEAFEPEHAQVFFGRTRARNHLREALAAQLRDGRPLLLVMGASGSGKSSLVKAGLLPDLMLPGMLPGIGLVRPALLRPSDRGDDPVRALASALVTPKALPRLALGSEGVVRAEPEVAAAAVRQALAEIADAAQLAAPWQARLVLVIDQLEELFAETVPAAKRTRFVTLLEALVRGGDTLVVATLRSDFFDRLETVPTLVDLSAGAGRYLLLPPSDAEIGQIITGPAQEAGLTFQPHPETGIPLNEALRSAAAGQAGALPLLEFTLEQLWQQRASGAHAGELTWAAYDRLGGLEAAIGRRAEEVFAAQSEQVQAALPRLLFSLARVEQGEKGRLLARAVAADSVAEGSPERHLAEALIAPDARLVVADEHGHWRLAHEALLSHWPRTREIVERDREDLQLRDRLQQAAADWSAADRRHKASYLLQRGLPLSQAEDLLARRRAWLEGELPQVVALIEASTAQARRRMRQLQAAVVAFATLAFVAMGLGWLAKDRADEAEHQAVEATRQKFVAERQKEKAIQERNQALIAQSHFLARKAQEAVSRGDHDAARAIVLAALPRDSRVPERPLVADAQAALSANTFADFLWAVLKGHTDKVRSAAFSPSGDRVVTASDDYTARLWDASTGAEIAVLKGHASVINSTVFSPSGDRVVTASADKTARLWDASTGTTIAVLKGHTDAVISATFSPSGNRVVTASADKTARLWDASSGAEISVLKGHADWVMYATFNPSGDRVVTASEDHTARLWDVRSGAAVAVLKGHAGKVWSAAFSPSGNRVVTASLDDTARLWDARSGAKIAVLKGHTGPVWSAAFSPSGDRVVTASGDMTARLWDGRSGAEIAVLSGHTAEVNSASFSPSGDRVATASLDHTTRLWDANSGAEIAVLRGHTAEVKSASFSPSGDRVVTASDDHTARLWDVRSGGAITVLKGHTKGVGFVAFSPSGDRVVTASWDNTARLWDAHSGVEIAVLTGHTDQVNSAAFSPSGDRVVTASNDYTARLWDGSSGAEVSVLTGHAGRVRSAAFSPSGDRVVTASNDYTARLWDASNGAEIAVLTGHTYEVRSASFSPSGDRVVTASDDRTARLWDARTGAKFTVLKGHTDNILSAAFSPSGDRVVTASADKTARLWDASNGVELAVLKGHADPVWSAAFSPSGDQVVTASVDKTARLWDAHSGAELNVLKGHTDAVVSAAFSSSDDRVVTASWDGTARLWDAPKGTEINVAQMRAVRALSGQEQRDLFLDGDKTTLSSADIDSCDTLAAFPYDPHRVGPGVAFARIDVDRAIAACREAVARHPDTPRFHYQLGRALAKLGDETGAIAAYQLAVEHGYAAAFNNLANIEEFPRDAPDGPAVIANYRRALNGGVVVAARPLGRIYWDGRGVPQDRDAALRLWRQGADRGDPFSHAQLAKLYERGDHVAKDLKQALLHHALAARLFAEAGDVVNADFETTRRGTLARALPSVEVGPLWYQVLDWRPTP